MATSLADKVPCRYVIAKYIGDEIRDEPINIGIIIQSQNNRRTISNFITNYHKIRTGGQDVTILKEILDKIHVEVSESNDSTILDKIVQKYAGKIRFTEPRGTLATSLDMEANSLFQRYISIEQPFEEKIEKVTLPIIKKRVWGYLHRDYPNYAKRNVTIEGVRSKFRYDFVLGQKDAVIQAISYDSLDSLKKTKLVDWHIMDAIQANGLTNENFGILVSPPSTDLPKYDKMKEQFNEGYRILESKSYNLITFDMENRWMSEIQELV